MSEEQQNSPSNQDKGPKQPNYPPNYRPPSKKTKWWIPVSIIAGVFIMFFIFIVALISFADSTFSFKSGPVKVKDQSVLSINLSGGAPEYVRQDPLDFLGGSKGSSYFDVLHAIERAKDDSKIKGLYINISGRVGMAKSTELQEKLADFKESGKFVYSFIETGDENTYYNSLAADSIFMPKEGLLEFNGYANTGLFMKGFFKKLGIEYHVEKFEDYKSAGESFNREGFSDSARKQLEIIYNQFQDRLIESISKHRGLSKDKIVKLLNQGLFTADSIHAHGLVDALMTESQVHDLIKERLNPGLSKDSVYSKKLETISVAKYLRSEYENTKEVDEDKMIAIVSGVGPIMSGEGEQSLFGGDQEIRSKRFVRNLRDAAQNEDVDAIIIRIDSPGGSVIASDEIWQEIIRAKGKKPVIASMSDVAASGGYYMAMACDKIIAHPQTITGSIGVILAIPNFEGTLDLLDIKADTISTTESAQFLNPMFKYTKEDKEKLRNLAKAIYFRFLEKAAESRNMSVSEMREVAKGRVWTGTDAKNQGLIDELGGMEYTIDYVKNMIGVEEGKLVRVKRYPEKKDEFQAFLESLGLEDGNGNIKEQRLREDLGSEFGPNIKNLIKNMDHLTPEMRSQLKYALSLYEISKNEHAMMALPYMIEFK